MTIGDYYYDSGIELVQDQPERPAARQQLDAGPGDGRLGAPSDFAQLLGIVHLNTTAMATAAHRPRDTVIVVDFSGSMRFESMLGGPHGGLAHRRP